jgi:Zn-dependent M28 family amino/carboxypeptidase
MHSAKTILTGLLLCCVMSAADFSGKSALEFTRAVVELGPRPPGSRTHGAMQDYIRRQLNQWECEVSNDSFTADTPIGPVKMTNIIARFPGSSGRAVVVSGHYDTKYMKRVRFVGANDAGSSTGLLLEMARVLSGAKRIHDVYVVFFDGEEAYGTWSKTDGVYGSRHLAARWAKDGTLRKIDALINVDMIGDKNLAILNEYYSTRSLMGLVHQSAAELGYERHFLRRRGAIEDDHVPFLRLGVNAVDLIDFEYGDGNEYWHTAEDTLDKLDAKSLEVVGRVVLRVVGKLEEK